MKFLFKYLKVNSKLLIKKSLLFLKLRVEFKTFVILLSIVVGIISGLAAVLLKNIVLFIHQEPPKIFSDLGINFLLPLTPLLGIILSVIVTKLLFNGKITVGLSNIIYRILRKSSDIPKQDLFSHLLTSGITIGFGGSASSAVLSKFLYSGQLFYLVTEGWQIEAVPFYILLGILCGFVSLYMIKVTYLSERLFDKHSNK